MATNPPVSPDKLVSTLLDLARALPKQVEAYTDSINTKTGDSAKLYKEVHALALKLKDAVNDSYKAATAADRAVQTGKRKGKEKAKGEGPSEEAKQIRKDDDRKAARADRRQKAAASRGTNDEHQVTEQGADEP